MDWSLLGFQGSRQLLNVHPAFVHFPIAFFPAALLFYFLAIVLKKERFLPAGRVSLILAWASTVLAVITGQTAQDTFPHTEAVHRLMMVHQKTGFGILILGSVLTGWSFFRRNNRPRGVWAFLAALFLAVLMVFQNADLGGRMVFVEGAAVKPMIPQMEETMDHHHGEDVPPHRH